jgi:hypothetical protein
MVKRADIRNAASTLAHHWCRSEPMDRIGVERCIKAYPPALQLPLCANILLLLHERGFYTHADSFEALLFDLADVEED